MIGVEVPCSCPGRPHEGDTVSLAPALDVRIGSAAMAAMREAPSSVMDMEGAIAGAFLHFGPRAWTFVDEAGEPLPLTADNIDARLTWAHGGMEVAEKANELYAGDLFAPLVARLPSPSPTGPTESSISATRRSGRGRTSSGKPSLRAVSGGTPSEARAS